MDAVNDVREKAEHLQNAIAEQTSEFQFFLDKCNHIFLGVSEENEFLLNFGPMNDITKCIEQPGAQYVAAYCGVNPVIALFEGRMGANRIPGSKAVLAGTRRLHLAESTSPTSRDTQQRQLNAIASGGAVDVCAESR